MCVCVRERGAAGKVKVKAEKEADALGNRVVGGYKVSDGENQWSSDLNCGRQKSGRKSLAKQDYKTKAGVGGRGLCSSGENVDHRKE